MRFSMWLSDDEQGVKQALVAQELGLLLCSDGGAFYAVCEMCRPLCLTEEEEREAFMHAALLAGGAILDDEIIGTDADWNYYKPVATTDSIRSASSRASRVSAESVA